MANKINMHKFRTNGSKIYSGRDQGIEARKELNLDKEDTKDDVLVICFPKDTWAINSSFFGGLFEKSIIDLQKDRFQNKYRFEYSDGTELSRELQQNIEESIFDALNDI